MLAKIRNEETASCIPMPESFVRYAALADRSSRVPLRWSRDYIDCLLDRILGNLGCNRVSLLGSFFHGREVQWGSGCSGTDSPGWVHQAFRRKWQCIPRHRFSAEIVPAKREFILRHHQPDMLFTDVFDLSRRSARDVKSGQDRQACSVDIYWCGFSCRTVSNLQTTDVEIKGRCLLSFEGSTGQTFLSVLLFIDNHRPARPSTQLGCWRQRA